MSRESENSTGKISHIPIKNRIKVIHGAVDPHSFFADPDPAVLLKADPDVAAFLTHYLLSGIEKD